MILEDLVEIVVKVGAPTIASMLGSPLAGAALSLLGSHFGISRSSTDINHWMNCIAKAIQDNPAKLKELEYRHQEAILSMLEGLASEGVQNASKWLVDIALVIALIGLLTLAFYLISDMS